MKSIYSSFREPNSQGQKILLGSLIPLSFFLAGCSSSFWGGTATGAVGAGAGYEYKAKAEMDRIEKDYKEGQITKEEYEARKDQIRRMSIAQ